MAGAARRATKCRRAIVRTSAHYNGLFMAADHSVDMEDVDIAPFNIYTLNLDTSYGLLNVLTNWYGEPRCC